ncbi:730_t:CDS:2, partial [Dentiscutata erythropus]
SYDIQVSRNIKQLMTNSWKNYLGFTPDLETIPYCTSIIASNVITNNTDPNSLYSIINIEPYSFIVEVDTDQKSKTALNLFGLFGGVFGILTSLYAFLFGVKAIQPWGLVQRTVFKVNKTARSQLLTTLESMQFLDHLNNDKDNLEDQVSTKKLKKRLDTLQLFLRDYVVNAQYLEQINENINRNKNS